MHIFRLKTKSGGGSKYGHEIPQCWHFMHNFCYIIMIQTCIPIKHTDGVQLKWIRDTNTQQI